MRLYFITFMLTIKISFSFSQEWKFKALNDPFDGKYKSASVVGTGVFPYNNPLLVINYFEKDQSLNIYFNQVTYAGCDNLIIYIKFDNEEKIYEYDASTNSDRKSWFISTYAIESDSLFNIMKSKNKMHVRLISNCGKDDYEFPLKGSTIAINFVTKDYFVAMKQIKLTEENDRLTYEIWYNAKVEEMKKLDKEQKNREDAQKKIIDSVKNNDVKFKTKTFEDALIYNKIENEYILLKEIKQETEIVCSRDPADKEHYIIYYINNPEFILDRLYYLRYGDINFNIIEIIDK